MTNEQQQRARLSAEGRSWRMVFAAIAAGAAIPSLGAGYDNSDFSLRFPAALSRFSSYAAVAAVGGAQAASEWSSSLNPASAAWPHPGRLYPHSASPQFTTLHFGEHTDIFATAEAVLLNGGPWGVFVPAMAQLRSNHGHTGAGVGFKFNADYYQLQWGKMLGDHWAAGANFNYTATETRFDSAGALLARTRGDTYDFRLGLLTQPAPALRLGLTVDYGASPSWTDAGGARTELETQRVLARPGLVWRYAPQGNLYVDYQSAAFWNGKGTLWAHRFPVGLEYWFTPGKMVGRMGTTVDTHGNAAVAAGAGFQVSKRLFANLAYQYGMFPELRREFGPAHTFALSVAAGF